MPITVLLKLLLTGVATAAAGFSGTTLYHYTQTPHTINQLYLFTGILVLCLVVTVLLIRSVFRPADLEILKRFQAIDSTALDASKALCHSFYGTAFTFRLQHGSKKYQQHIMKQFRFFYEFHNAALKWIDDIATQTSPHLPSAQFVSNVISSGHIGQVFSEIRYGGKLSGVSVPIDAPLLIYASRHGIEIWTENFPAPLCVFSKRHLLLNRPTKQQDIVSALLNAELPHNRQPVEIEFHFPDYQLDKTSGKVRHHEVYATQNYERFKEWLAGNSAESLTSAQSNFGISVEHKLYSDYSIAAPELIPGNPLVTVTLESVLRELKGARIDTFFTKDAMRIVKPASALDVLVACSGLGLVIITECTHSGSITFSGDPGWVVIANGRSQIIDNVCLQAERASASLAKLLRLRNLCNWPIHSLVVFSADNVELHQDAIRTRLQCDVIKLADLEQWFISNRCSPEIRFTTEDLQQLTAILNRKSRRATNSTTNVPELANE